MKRLAVCMMALLVLAPVGGFAQDSSNQGDTETTADTDRLVPPEDPQKALDFFWKVTRDPELFQKMLKKENQLTPQQIRMLRLLKEEKQRARYSDDVPSRKKRYHLEVGPGMSAPAVRIAKNNIGDVVFLDRLGNPWPVAHHVVGNDNWFNVPSPVSDKSSHILRVMANRYGVDTNMSVTLEKLSIPVNINVTESSDTHYEQTIIQFDRRGPTSPDVQVKQTDQDVSIGDEVMSKILDRVPPSGAVEYNLDPVHAGRIWKYNGSFYLRTSQALLSPHPEKVTPGMGGVRVFKIKEDVPLLSMSLNGEQQYVSISEPNRLNREMQKGEDS